MKNQQPICGRNNFPFYFNCREQLDLLTDQERGRLLMAVMDYTEYGTEPQSLTPTEKLVFAGMRFGLDRDFDTYQEKVAAGRANGKRGGRPRKDAAEPDPVQPAEPIVGAVSGRPPVSTDPTANTTDPIVGAVSGRPPVSTTPTLTAEQPENTALAEGSFLNPKEPTPFFKTPTATPSPSPTPTPSPTPSPTPTSTPTSTPTASPSPAATAATCPTATAEGLSAAAPMTTPTATAEVLPSTPVASPDATTMTAPKASPVASATPPAGEEAAAAVNPVIFWKDNFGALSPYVLKCITEYRYQGCADDLVVYALERTLEAGTKDFAYARKILDDACQSKLLTRAEFLQHKRHGCSGHNAPVTREGSAAGNNFLADAMTRKRNLKRKDIG